MKTIREVIGANELKKLKAYVIGSEDIKDATKENLLRTFEMLYFTGCRLNELHQITIGMIRELIVTKELIITTYKTKSERKVLFSDGGVKAISKLFADSLGADEPDETLIIKVRASVVLNRAISDKVFLRTTNKVIKDVLGGRYSSHSFRGGMITELANARVNPKVIQKLMNHKDIKTTMRYINPSEEDMRGALVR